MILVLKGDKRQDYLAKILIEKGLEVAYEPDLISCEISEIISNSKSIILPMPCRLSSGDNEGILGLSEYSQVRYLYGGNIPEFIKNYCERNEIACHDYLKDEKFVGFNAHTTAEGAVAEALCEHPGNIKGSDCIVLGYGKCGKAISDVLKLMGANVSICSKEYYELEEAAGKGFNLLRLDDLKKGINEFELIFNTIPSLVLDSDALEKVKPNATIIDIASSPGGVDYKKASQLGINAKLCLGLPGKYSPVSSAMSMADFIIERGFE